MNAKSRFSSGLKTRASLYRIHSRTERDNDFVVLFFFFFFFLIFSLSHCNENLQCYPKSCRDLNETFLLAVSPERKIRLRDGNSSSCRLVSLPSHRNLMFLVPRPSRGINAPRMNYVYYSHLGIVNFAFKNHESSSDQRRIADREASRECDLAPNNELRETLCD